MSQEPTPALPAFDRLWNFNDPAATETKFRELLPAARAAGEVTYVAELLTQIARAEGLQQKYADADATLDEAEALLTPAMTPARVRALLERGRVLNSSGRPQQSVPVFERALNEARSAGLDFYAVDAAHMLGIVCKGDESLQWNEEAIRLAEAAKEPRARNWLGALYNNTGWTYSDMGRYGDALRMFEKHLSYRTEQKNDEQMAIARWSIAKMYRLLGRVQDALSIQLQLVEDPARKGNDSEGYTQEEIGECLLQLERAEDAKPHFARAWELLKDDLWLKQDEPQRLERLKSLGGL